MTFFNFFFGKYDILSLNTTGSTGKAHCQWLLAGNFESFHSCIESESCLTSCTIKGSSDPEQLGCAQVSAANQPITKTWLWTDFW